MPKETENEYKFRCWEEKYKGDSHPGLVQPEDLSKDPQMWRTVTHDSYPLPKNDNVRTVVSEEESASSCNKPSQLRKSSISDDGVEGSESREYLNLYCELDITGRVLMSQITRRMTGGIQELAGTGVINRARRDHANVVVSEETPRRRSCSSSNTRRGEPLVIPTPEHRNLKLHDPATRHQDDNFVKVFDQLGNNCPQKKTKLILSGVIDSFSSLEEDQTSLGRSCFISETETPFVKPASIQRNLEFEDPLMRPQDISALLHQLRNKSAPEEENRILNGAVDSFSFEEDQSNLRIPGLFLTAQNKNPDRESYVNPNSEQDLESYHRPTIHQNESFVTLLNQQKKDCSQKIAAQILNIVLDSFCSLEKDQARIRTSESHLIAQDENSMRNFFVEPNSKQRNRESDDPRTSHQRDTFITLFDQQGKNFSQKITGQILTDDFNSYTSLDSMVTSGLSLIKHTKRSFKTPNSMSSSLEGSATNSIRNSRISNSSDRWKKIKVSINNLKLKANHDKQVSSSGCSKKVLQHTRNHPSGSDGFSDSSSASSASEVGSIGMLTRSNKVESRLKQRLRKLRADTAASKRRIVNFIERQRQRIQHSRRPLSPAWDEQMLYNWLRDIPIVASSEEYTGQFLDDQFRSSSSRGRLLAEKETNVAPELLHISGSMSEDEDEENKQLEGIENVERFLMSLDEESCKNERERNVVLEHSNVSEIIDEDKDQEEEQLEGFENIGQFRMCLGEESPRRLLAGQERNMALDSSNTSGNISRDKDQENEQYQSTENNGQFWMTLNEKSYRKLTGEQGGNDALKSSSESESISEDRHQKMYQLKGMKNIGQFRISCEEDFCRTLPNVQKISETVNESKDQESENPEHSESSNCELLTSHDRIEVSLNQPGNTIETIAIAGKDARVTLMNLLANKSRSHHVIDHKLESQSRLRPWDVEMALSRVGVDRRPMTSGCSKSETQLTGTRRLVKIMEDVGENNRYLETWEYQYLRASVHWRGRFDDVMLQLLSHQTPALDTEDFEQSNGMWLKYLGIKLRTATWKQENTRIYVYWRGCFDDVTLQLLSHQTPALDTEDYEQSNGMYDVVSLDSGVLYDAPIVSMVFSYITRFFNFLGRRRELVRKFLDLQVSKETMNEIIADPPTPPPCPTEYVDNYCDTKFTPFLDRTDYDVDKHLKYPLYGGGIKTFYKEQIDGGIMKARSEIYNFNEPFRKSSFFTTPPELANREPTGGY